MIRRWRLVLPGAVVLAFSLGCLVGTDPLPEDSGRALPDPSGTDTFESGETGQTGPTGETGAPPFDCLQDRALAKGQFDLTLQYAPLALDLSVIHVPFVPTIALPAGLLPASYYGAVEPGSSAPWWLGWTYHDDRVDGALPGLDFHPLEEELLDGTLAGSLVNECASISADLTDGGVVSVFGQLFPVCIVSQRITEDQLWRNDHVYLLTDTIAVGTGDVQLSGGTPTTNPTLTIQSGTQVYATPGATSLAVTRGARIEATGTADLPIVFGSVAGSASSGIIGDPTDLTDRGQWGGLVLSGFGQVNRPAPFGEVRSFAAPLGQEPWFGGSNDGDSSGTLRYVIVAEGGSEIQPGDRMPAVVLQGVGAGTIVDNVQVSGSADDCFEFVGGAVRSRWLVCNGPGNDGLDIDLGYRGSVQFGIVRLGTIAGDRGIEADSNLDDPDATPFTAPVLANLTVLGHVGSPRQLTTAAMFREGFRGTVLRSVFADDHIAGGLFEGGCLDVDDVLPPELTVRDTLVDCATGPLAPCDSPE